MVLFNNIKCCKYLKSLQRLWLNNVAAYMVGLKYINPIRGGKSGKVIPGSSQQQESTEELIWQDTIDALNPNLQASFPQVESLIHIQS